MNAEVQVPAPDLSADTRYTHIMYALHLLAPFTAWILAVVAIIMGIVKSDDIRGTYLESHVRWLSRTFWFGLLWIVVACVLTWILIISLVGILVAWIPGLALFVWYIYRVIKGWLTLNDGKPIA
ncbi:DUF4870 family protein [Usitatibacter palustris]|uniref:Transmembrane protein n=1 Tax=Usitatibacter palustris TaxID=2732487 RepID=A0A6M4H4D5_9PROT|nr:hypothetical protein [Usitatibacter palustris]QJR14142.1 hypothetical protein DSM104440_00935 [Usitatibacter palustris]